jgi:hypothetical protein
MNNADGEGGGKGALEIGLGIARMPVLELPIRGFPFFSGGVKRQGNPGKEF